MYQKARSYAIPARAITERGDPRHVGFELEFAGMEFKDTVQVLADVLDVPATTHTSAEASLRHPELGKFVVEVDSELAKQLAKARANDRGSTDDPLAEWVVNLTTELVPVEVVCPPIPIRRLPVLDEMVNALREAGATAGGAAAAFWPCR